MSKLYKGLNPTTTLVGEAVYSKTYLSSLDKWDFYNWIVENFKDGQKWMLNDVAGEKRFYLIRVKKENGAFYGAELDPKTLLPKSFYKYFNTSSKNERAYDNEPALPDYEQKATGSGGLPMLGF